ncbi:class I SAM-dependent methyltransferase [Candidatus Pelagibacter sp.]|nr:class I SAM-dependent methyltransferase [Candidatus Pelagibacter sp.]
MKNCLCESNRIIIKFKYFKKPIKEKLFKIKNNYKRFFYLCKNCGHMFAKHFFIVEKFYSKQYFELVYRSQKNLEKKFNFISNLPLIKSDNKNRANRIEEFFDFKKKSVLDVGSGSGIFLFEMKKKNWKTIGFEQDARYSNFCKKKLNLKIHTKNLESIKSKYDLITFNKVLEHIVNPVKFLSKFKNKLKSKSYIYIEVPDVVAANKGKNRQEFGLEHFHVFSVSSLDILIEKAGFKTIEINRIQDPSDKYTLYAFAKKK